MADNFYRQATNGPILVRVSATGSTILETGTRADGTDLDANPYTTSGQTRTALINRTATGGDLASAVVGGMKVALGPWIAQNLATNQAAAINLGAVANATGTSVPYAGSILGLVVNLQTHLTTASLKGWVTVNGTSVAATNVTFGTAAGVLYKATTLAKDASALAAGDIVGVKLTSTSNMAPTTNDVVAVVYIEQ